MQISDLYSKTNSRAGVPFVQRVVDDNDDDDGERVLYYEASKRWWGRCITNERYGPWRRYRSLRDSDYGVWKVVEEIW